MSIEEARENFLKLKLGMFIHFGLYSQGKEHEWHMRNHKMSLKEYSDQLLKTFNPDPDGIREWVHVAKSMGARYIVVTSKHCDGFRLWDTEILHPFDNDYHIKNTDYFQNNNTGVLEVLCEEAKKHDIKVGFYHAVIDWSWNKARTRILKRRKPHSHWFREEALNQQFIAFLNPQLEELLRKFPETLLFWFDGYHMTPDGLNRLNFMQTYQNLHSIKNEILLGVNRGTTSKKWNNPEGDFLIYENMAHFGEMNGVVWPRHDPDQLPAEGCLTINNHWGYNEKDKKYKDLNQLAQLIAINAQRRSNTLVNFGPKPDGYIAEDQVALAQKLGEIRKTK